MESKKKKCNKCEELKDLEEFYNDQRSPDGKGYTCKACKKKQRKEYHKLKPTTGAEWDKENQEKARERKRRYAESIKKIIERNAK